MKLSRLTASLFFITFFLSSAVTHGLPEQPAFSLSKEDQRYFEQLTESLNKEQATLLNIQKQLGKSTTEAFQLAPHEIKTDNTFSSGYVMQGIGETSLNNQCKGVKHSQLLMLQSLDGAAEIESRYHETTFTTPENGFIGEYESFYRYVVPSDKINTEYATSGEYKRQFNGIVMQEKLPGNRKELLAKNTLLISPSKQHVLTAIKNGKATMSFLEAPEDIENSAVLNHIQMTEGFNADLRIILSKTFIIEKGAWVFDGYGIELINLHGLSLYRQLAMASGVSLLHKATAAKYLVSTCKQ